MLKKTFRKLMDDKEYERVVNRLYNEDGIFMPCHATKADVEYLEKRANELYEMLKRLMNLKTEYWKKRAESLLVKIRDELHEVRLILNSIPPEVTENEV